MKDTRQMIDLTHSLSSDNPSFDGDCCFSLHTTVDYKDCKAPDLFRVQKITSNAGAGTHIDAPAHCFADGKTIDALSVESLVADGVVIHVDEEADEHYKVTPDVIERFEKKYGNIPPNSFVIFHTGWDAYWNTPKKYRNDLRFPSVHEDTATLLLQREIVGMGIDTLSPDAGGVDFPVHRVILGAGKYIVENVANAKRVPPMGAKILVMPMKIQDGTEAPIRLVALTIPQTASSPEYGQTTHRMFEAK